MKLPTTQFHWQNKGNYLIRIDSPNKLNIDIMQKEWKLPHACTNTQKERHWKIHQKRKKKSFGVYHDIVECLFCYNFTAAKILQ
jgi:hypothetical protein